VAKAKGCDVLLTDMVFDGFSLDGIMLAEQIQRVNPNVNIVFVTDHADTSAAFSAWQLGASAFLLRPYEKQRLAKALADPRFALV
jgi:FixJ family two-component response regulator